MNDIEILINYIKDNSNNFLGTKSSLRELEAFEYFYNLLMDTLEKQIPKKPTEHYNWCDLTTDDFRWYCKNCDNNLDETEKHCPNCGQCLDWEVENE